MSDLIAKEIPTKIPVEYLNFADIFFLDLVSEFFEHTKINNHAVKLVIG